MADVFISFIHEEERIAKTVQMYLEKHLQYHLSQGVFLSDDWQVFAGEIWLDRIKQELHKAKVVILMLSPQSVQRPWINFEGGAAWLAKKAVIPVCFHGLTKGQMPKPYSDMQSLELPDDYDYLLRSVLHHLDPNASPPLLLPINHEDKKRLNAALAGQLWAPQDLPWLSQEGGGTGE